MIAIIADPVFGVTWTALRVVVANSATVATVSALCRYIWHGVHIDDYNTAPSLHPIPM